MVIDFIPYIGDPVLDMISPESGLNLNNGGHHCETGTEVYSLRASPKTNLIIHSKIAVKCTEYKGCHPLFNRPWRQGNLI